MTASKIWHIYEHLHLTWLFQRDYDFRRICTLVKITSIISIVKIHTVTLRIRFPVVPNQFWMKSLNKELCTGWALQKQQPWAIPRYLQRKKTSQKVFGLSSPRPNWHSALRLADADGVSPNKLSPCAISVQCLSLRLRLLRFCWSAIAKLTGIVSGR